MKVRAVAEAVVESVSLATVVEESLMTGLPEEAVRPEPAKEMVSS